MHAFCSLCPTLWMVQRGYCLGESYDFIRPCDNYYLRLLLFYTKLLRLFCVIKTLCCGYLWKKSPKSWQKSASLKSCKVSNAPSLSSPSLLIKTIEKMIDRQTFKWYVSVNILHILGEKTEITEMKFWHQLILVNMLPRKLHNGILL